MHPHPPALRYTLLLLGACLLARPPGLLAEAVETTPAPAAFVPAEAMPAWSQQLAGRIRPGELISLDGRDGSFAALFRRDESGQPLGAVILLHEAGANPAWPRVISPLRRRLPAHGWQSLALELPAPLAEGEIPAEDAAFGRIDAALDFLKSQGANQVVLIGHGQGAAIAQDFAAKGAGHILGVVCISPYTPLILAEGAQQSQMPPILDIHGERDLPRVQQAVASRRLMARRAGLDRPSRPAFIRTALGRTLPDPANTQAAPYQSLLISGADHGYTGYERPLVKRLLGWLRHLPSTATGDGTQAL